MKNKAFQYIRKIIKKTVTGFFFFPRGLLFIVLNPRKVWRKVSSADFYLDALAGFLRFFIRRNPIGLVHKNFNQQHPYLSAATSFVLIISLLAGTIWWVFMNGNESEAGWWDETWMYRKKIEVSSSGNLTDFQIKILDNKDLSADITAGKIQSDLDDLRFTDKSGNMLPYWIEDATNNSVDVWIKAPLISTSGNTFYMYYGNSAAASKQNGNNVFEFFDDFNDNSIDASKWTLHGNTWTEIGGQLEMPASGTSGTQFSSAVTKNFTIADAIIETKMTPIAVGSSQGKGVAFRFTDVNNTYIATTEAWTLGNIDIGKRVSSTWTNLANVAMTGGVTAGTSYKQLIKYSGTSFTNITTNLSSAQSTTATSTGDTAHSGAKAVGVIVDRDETATGARFDYYFVRKYVATDPAAAAPGTEEKSTGPVGYWKFDEGQGGVANDTVWKKTGTTTNMVTNPSVETDTTGWTWWLNSGTGTAVRSTDTAKFGSYSLKSTMTSNGSFGHQAGMTNVSGSTTYSVSGWVNITSWGGSNFTFYMREYYPTGNGQCGTTLYTASGVTNGWVRFTGTCTTRSDTTQLMVSYYLGDVGQIVYVDGIQIEQTVSSTKYCDGSLTGNGARAWTGTAHASSSNCDMSTEGEISAPLWKAESECIAGKCLEFDGSASSVLVSDTAANNPLDLTTGLTISMWVKPTSYTHAGGGNYPSPIGKHSDIYRLFFGSTGTLNFRLNNVTGSDLATSSTVPLNQWTHIEATYDSSSGYRALYLNGKLAASRTDSGTIGVSNQPLFIGDAWGTKDRLFKGLIDEVKVYPYARSAAQAKTDYNAGLAGSGSSEGTSGAVGDQSDKWMTDGLVGYWKMDEASWNNNCSETSVIDSSGNTKNGAACPASTGPTGGAAGKFGNAGNFDGLNDYVSIPNSSANLSGNFALSMWISPNDDADNPRWFSLIDGSNNLQVGHMGGDEKVYFRFGGSTIQTTIGISLSTWHHVVWIMNGGNRSIYIDGVLMSTQNGGITADAAYSAIGGGYAGYTANAKIDDVRLYTRSLSPDEIKKLYDWAPGPVAHWKMDEGNGVTANDSSGNGNNRTVTNGSWDTGKYNGALKLSGNGYMDTGYGNGRNMVNPFTVSMWVYPTANSQMFLATANGSNQRFYFGIYGNKWDIGVYDSVWGTGTQNVEYNKWHYITIIADGSTVKLYVNNNLSIQKAYSAYSLSTHISIGSQGPGGAYMWNGLIDDVKFYEYARTAKQVTEDMNAGHPVGGSPVGSQVGYWKFDEGHETTAYDTISSNNGTISGATWSNQGRFGKALSFDGSNDYVSMSTSSPELGTGDFSISLWAYLGDSAGQWQRLAGKKAIAAANAGYSIYWGGDTNKLMWSTANGSTANEYWTNDTITENTWHHIVMIRKGADPRIGYFVIDGVRYDITTIPTMLDVSSASQNFSVGALPDGTLPFKGKIDEVKVYNYALSEEEIKIDMNQGKSLVLGSSGTESNGIAPASSSSREYCVPGDTSTCNSPVAEWKFDEMTGGTANDTSGGGYTGLFENDTTWINGKVGSAIRLDGTGDNVNMGNVLDLGTGNRTYSAWFKLDTSTLSENKYIISKTDNSTTQYRFALGITPSSEIRVVLRGSGNSNYDNNFLMSSLDTNWHFITMTIDRASVYSIYLDGRLLGTKDISAIVGQNFVINRPFRVGSYSDSSNNPVYAFPGLIDHVQIYDYARTPAQIAYDYNRGKPIAHWKLDECEGNTAYDHSGNGNHGTITIGGTVPQTAVGTCTTSGTAWGNGASGKLNSSLNFDGADDRLVISNFNGLSGNYVTVSAWVKVNTMKNWNRFVNHEWGSADPAKWLFYTTVNGPAFGIWNLSGQYNATYAMNLTDGWHHLTGVYDGSYVRLYVDGVLKSSVALSNQTLDNDGAVDFGGADSTSSMDGQIDDVRIYNYALTAEQIKQVMNDGAIRYGQ